MPYGDRLATAVWGHRAHDRNVDSIGYQNVQPSRHRSDDRKVVPFSNQYTTNCTDKDEVRALNLDCSPQAEVQFLTRNEAPAIKYKTHTVFPKLTGKDHELGSEGGESHAALGMWDLAYARRFGKAFRHAVELCGGRPSAF